MVLLKYDHNNDIYNYYIFAYVKKFISHLIVVGYKYCRISYSYTY